MKKAVLHNSATRKAAKLARMHGGSRLKKDPGIPNLWPFKERLLKRAQRDRIKSEKAAELWKQQKALERAKRKKELKRTGNVDNMAVSFELVRPVARRTKLSCPIHLSICLLTYCGCVTPLRGIGSGC